MRTKLLLPLVLLAALGLLAGCGKKSPSSLSSPLSSSPGATSAEQTAVVSTLAQTPQVVEDGESESADTSDVCIGRFRGTMVNDTLRFWRRITDVARNYSFVFADTDTTGKPTRAVVTVDKQLTGTFNLLVVLPPADSTASDSFRVVHKPLADHWVRRLQLERRTGTDYWHVTAASGAQMTSQGAATRITSLRVQSGDLDTTLTDPLAFLHLRRIFAFSPGDSVTLTVTTLRNDDDVFLMLRGRRPLFHNNGDGTYTKTFYVFGRRGMAHFGVNALSHGTLFDDTAAYDSQAWLFPFVCYRDELADQLP